MKKLFNYYEKMFNNQTIGQAFLIGNVNFEMCKNELQEIFNNFFFNQNFNIEENPDIYILKSDNSLITRDMVRDLLQKISITSQISDKKVYIIDGAENLSDKVYNSLLKTLEEPNPNIYAFLLTNNIDKVESTISSRCQKIFIESSNIDENNLNEVRDEVNEIIEYIENNEEKTIALNSNIYKLISDRLKFIEILKVMFDIYKKALYTQINGELDEQSIICLNNTREELSKKVLLIDDTISTLSNYLNKNLAIDRFIIDMWRCKNEKCSS